MKLSSLKFKIPETSIAKYPNLDRDTSKLMVINRSTGKIEHRLFKDLIEYFGPDDSIVLNDSKIFQAKLFGKKEKTGAKIEVFLLRELKEEDHQWDALVDPARKIRVGNKLFFGDVDLVAEVSDNTTSRGRTLKFLFDGSTEDLYKIFDSVGNTPIPNWILDRNVEKIDKEYYQTVYAENIGSVVPSFAGLHFTKYLLKLLELENVSLPRITIHTGLSDMSIIDVEDVTKYRVNAEYYNISEKSAKIINNSINKKGKVCAVDLGVLKALESSTTSFNNLKPIEDWTNKFIIPGYNFKICNSLLTNFHIPKSTLFMSSVAFLGEELLMHAYDLAVQNDYKFFVYGDSMLVV